jgi:hypothetical protein
VGVGAILGEIKAWEGCSPRVRTPGRLENGGGAMELRADGGEAPARQQTGHGLDNGRRMAVNRRWAVAELSGRARRARERARGFS